MPRAGPRKTHWPGRVIRGGRGPSSRPPRVAAVRAAVSSFIATAAASMAVQRFATRSPRWGFSRA